MDTCPHCGGDIDGDGYTAPLMCENFEPHEDLCPEPDSGPWYCDTDGFTKFEICDGCEIHRHPDTIITCTTTESDGNQDSYKLCEECRNHKKGTT